MNNEFVTNMIKRTESQIVELLHTTLEEYETLLKLNNKHGIDAWMGALTEHSKENKDWVKDIYMTTINYDMYLSGVTSFLSMVASKQVNLKNHNYLGFKEDKLFLMFDTMQTLNTIDVVDNNSMYVLAKQADKLLDKNSTEYRVIRLVCISKILGMSNITNVVSKLIVTQNNIKDKETISITPNIED